MDFRVMLCRELKKYDNVIIYGFKDIGTCMLDYIINLETDIKVSNYAGKVKFFAHTNPQEFEHEKKGIAIKSIEDLTEYADDALVIVATQEQHHENIKEVLEKLSFKSIMYIKHEDYIFMKEVVQNYNGIVTNQVMQYSLMHQTKLNRLREKVRQGKRIKVFFMTQRAAAFGCESIYKAMMQDDLFDPYIFTISKRDIWYRDFYKDVLEDVKFFEEKGFRVINGYDENERAKDLTILNPDIIFYDSPNLYGPANNSHFRLDHINWAFLTCYVPYGLLMVDSFYYHYNNINVRKSWKFFIDTASSYNRALSDAEFNGFNTVLAGYPKFDDYDKKDEAFLPEKLKNNNRTIIYAPHWSLDIENNFSTFDLYKDIFLDMVREYSNINFVFKPHPELGFRIKALSRAGRIDFTYEDYVDYMKEWESHPNGICITQGDYIKLFKRSSCMITDCGSFIGEYIPSLNPCIYIFNPRKSRQDDVYTPLAKEILDTYYVCRTREELEKQIQEVAIAGNDSKKEARESLFQKEFKNIGHAGEFITDYIKKLITE